MAADGLVEQMGISETQVSEMSKMLDAKVTVFLGVLAATSRASAHIARAADRNVSDRRLSRAVAAINFSTSKPNRWHRRVQALCLPAGHAPLPWPWEHIEEKAAFDEAYV
ncbi:hypothetical protein [Actinomadura geliboluensis]|uniref:Uncharacterized protein n=1 Tax=Actinomadura geliboluensis TaxID=882440 RepID=A0A5S4GA92_9ACTN|nr:hypothetical protein [Actinomadura geliboluensis]TMR29782.1 hypothetical protein ETD96_34920 [Actinomadura geliboluensis]